LDSWWLHDIIPQDVVRAHHAERPRQAWMAAVGRCRVTIGIGAHVPALMEPQHDLVLFFNHTGLGKTPPKSGGMWFFDPRAILLYDAMDIEG
jgi:hypothetical protein